LGYEAIYLSLCVGGYTSCSWLYAMHKRKRSFRFLAVPEVELYSKNTAIHPSIDLVLSLKPKTRSGYDLPKVTSPKWHLKKQITFVIWPFLKQNIFLNVYKSYGEAYLFSFNYRIHIVSLKMVSQRKSEKKLSCLQEQVVPTDTSNIHGNSNLQK